ncbi:MAG: class I tRNA ligase family protein, partial [Cyanobacteria bacterium Co-bin13]|nr:class I tRNA ligase family protein [Cyanobacteria bacterium Co-bin13]
DALRYTLIREVAGAGQDIRLEYDRKTDESTAVEASRNFTNKLWNASRFVMMNLQGKTPAQLGQPDLANLELADRWILSRFNQVVQKVRGYLGNYGMGEAAKELYDFIWGDFCDWYIELVKPRLQADGLSKLTAQQTLAFVLEGILKLLHPFMPHITEELWHTLTQAGENEFLAVQHYPAVVADRIDPSLEEQFELLIGTIRTIRNLRAEAGIKPGARIEAILKTENPAERRILLATETYIRDAAKVETLTLEGEAPVAPPAAAGGSKVDVKAVAAEVSDFWTTMRPLLEEPLTYLSEFFSDVRRPALSLLLLFGLLVVFLMLNSLLSSIELVPGLAGLLKLVGVGYTLWFTSRYLLKAEKRQQVWSSIDHWRQEVLGQPRALPGAAEPKLIKAADPTPLLPPAGATGSSNLTAPEPTEDKVDGLLPPAGAAESSNGRQQPQVPQRQLFAGVVGTVQVLIPLTGYVDVEALRAKLEKDLGKVEVEIKALSGRLSNAGFVDKAPAEVVQGARDALAEAQKQAEILQERLALL